MEVGVNVTVAVSVGVGVSVTIGVDVTVGVAVTVGVVVTVGVDEGVSVGCKRLRCKNFCAYPPAVEFIVSRNVTIPEGILLMSQWTSFWVASEGEPPGDTNVAQTAGSCPSPYSSVKSLKFEVALITA